MNELAATVDDIMVLLGRLYAENEVLKGSRKAMLEEIMKLRQEAADKEVFCRCGAGGE